MAYGPVDFLALEFKGNQFKGEILPALMDLVNREIVRVIDLVIVTKDAEGKVTMRELQQESPSVVSMFDPLKAQISGMIQLDDINMIGEKLENNTTGAIMLFENLWSTKFRDAVLNANGRLVMFERVAPEVVNETLEKFTKAGV